MIHRKIALILGTALMVQSSGVYAASLADCLSARNGVIAFVTLAAVGVGATLYRCVTRPVIKEAVDQEFNSASPVVVVANPADEALTQPQDAAGATLAPKEKNESVVAPEAEETVPHLLVTIQMIPLYDQISGSYNVYLQ